MLQLFNVTTSHTEPNMKMAPLGEAELKAILIALTNIPFDGPCSVFTDFLAIANGLVAWSVMSLSTPNRLLGGDYGTSPLDSRTHSFPSFSFSHRHWLLPGTLKCILVSLVT